MPATVLVVDDSRFTRALLRAQLEPRYRVLEAADGKQGLEVLQAQSVDLVLLDLQMPRMSGFEFMERYRMLSEPPPLVVCSANTQPDVERRVRHLGALRFVAKPSLLQAGFPQTLVEGVLAGDPHAALEGEAVRRPEPPPLRWSAVQDALVGALRDVSCSHVELLDEGRQERGLMPPRGEGTLLISAVGGLTGGFCVTLGGWGPRGGGEDGPLERAEAFLRALATSLADHLPRALEVSDHACQPLTSACGGGKDAVLASMTLHVAGLSRGLHLHITLPADSPVLRGGEPIRGGRRS